MTVSHHHRIESSALVRDASGGPRQTEWWDWNVYVANITEQLAQVAVVGLF